MVFDARIDPNRASESPFQLASAFLSGGREGFHFYAISNLEDISKDSTRNSRAPCRQSPPISVRFVIPHAPQVQHSSPPFEGELETLPLPPSPPAFGRPLAGPPN